MIDWFVGNTYVYRGEYPRRGDAKLHKVERKNGGSRLGLGIDGRKPELPVPDFTEERKPKGPHRIAGV